VKPHQAKHTALIAGVIMAITIPLTSTASAATSPATASGAAASHRSPGANTEACWFWSANLHYPYWEADKDRSMAWWARNGATQGNPVILEPQDGNSILDCFQSQGGFGNNLFAYQLANSDLCLNVAGNSHSVGAWIILWPCTYSSNELFSIVNNGLNDNSVALETYGGNGGLCIDLTNGYNRGSILEQKACKWQDIYQAWFVQA
jgi:Ricin-type beta-trefoil lectin domain